MGAVSEDLQAMFDNMCESADKRFIIATFNDDASMIVPAMVRTATAHWEEDFDGFQDSLAKVTSYGKGAAFGIYNFPVWTDSSHNEYNIYPTFFTHLTDDSDLSTMYHAATFLGNTLLAAGCADNSISVDAGDNYIDACNKLSGDDISSYRCATITDKECPFESFDGGEQNPCQANECESVDGSFATKGQYLGEACCGAIEMWCGMNPETQGCGTYAYEQIFENHCNEDFVSTAGAQDTLYLAPLVEEQAAIDAALAAEMEVEEGE